MNTTTHNTMMKPTSLRHKIMAEEVSPLNNLRSPHLQRIPASAPSPSLSPDPIASTATPPTGSREAKNHHPHQIVVDLPSIIANENNEWGSTISAAGDDCITTHSPRSALRNKSAHNNNDEQADQLILTGKLIVVWVAVAVALRRCCFLTPCLVVNHLQTWLLKTPIAVGERGPKMKNKERIRRQVGNLSCFVVPVSETSSHSRPFLLLCIYSFIPHRADWGSMSDIDQGIRREVGVGEAVPLQPNWSWQRYSSDLEGKEGGWYTTTMNIICYSTWQSTLRD